MARSDAAARYEASFAPREFGEYKYELCPDLPDFLDRSPRNQSTQSNNHAYLSRLTFRSA
jgi:hypothetical protein